MPAPTGYNYWVNWDSYSPAVYVSSSNDPVVAVSHGYTWGWPAATVNMRIPAGMSGATGTDGEILVIDGTKVHNMWRFIRTSNSTATTDAYAMADAVTGTGWGSKNPWQAAGITAAGHNMLAGLLVQTATDAGEINHALQFVFDFKLNKPGPVGEAIASDGGGSSDHSMEIIQEGQRIAIPKNVSMPSGLSPLGQKVFRALQNYGGFDIDNAGGVTGLRAQANAYDASTINALRADMNKMGPLLRVVSW